MKSIISGTINIIFLISLTGGTTAQDNVKVSDWPKSVTYEIFVQSFADSDHDGTGDFNGMTSKLDYLQDLGIEAVWLMPIHPSSTYHKYNVDDYYDVHPDYGTIQDFKHFVEEAHKRDIHVIIDLVINHSGRDNFWFREALKDQHIKYWDYYVWAHKDDPRVKPPPGQKRSNWHEVNGSDYLYFAHFTSNMPDLNYDNPKLKQEIFNIGKFWLTEMNVDGFRLDAARHIFPDERATDMHKWWEYFLQEMKKIKEDVYIVGEVWSDVAVAAPYLKGIPALFNFDLASAIIKAVNEEKGGQLAAKHKEILDAYKAVNPDYIDNTFLTNHDQDRVLSSVNGNTGKAGMAAAILLTLPGSPYIYYGEEIGMRGKKPDPFIREPFIWDIKSKDDSRTTWEEPRFSTDSAVTPLSLQITDENSVYNHYKRLIKLRNTSSALTFGDFVPVTIPDPSICAFMRSDTKESLLVIHNLSGEKRITRLPSNLLNYNSVYYSDKNARLRNRQVEIPGYSTIILSLAPAPLASTSLDERPPLTERSRSEHHTNLQNSKKSGLRKEVIESDITASVPRLDIPVYFLSGKFDYTVNKDLSRQYLEKLVAPAKGFYTFEHSAHSPMFEEPQRLKEILVEDVLKGSTKMADTAHFGSAQ